MKIGYKGLSANMTGHGKFQFKIGETYVVTNPSTQPRLCSSDGFHYCNTLEQVFLHYPYQYNNRYFEVEILGSYTDGDDKSTTTSLKILREVENEAEQIYYNSYFRLELVRKLQEQFPTMVMGGSFTLFLHGLRLKRWKTSGAHVTDFDVIIPYFTLFKNTDDFRFIDITNDNKRNGGSNGSDFPYQYEVMYNNKKESFKLDIRIDPYQKYEIINYGGFEYRVNSFLDILDAKIRYARKSNTKSGKKHYADLQEMMCNTTL